eukprot:CAMPEP_0170481168 /NCGR_PEP_ID=MMETSP0208-20121228/1720_1 /TAXON_ID=197538 /ORGANISM="Strombidium inclinatum, Strain S3" /LENGTH=80 /DNA_ID=CAMNT_0010753827 /DNA_START=147 /DNA_END=389 /DNA_ORIENTATION=-
MGVEEGLVCLRVGLEVCHLQVAPDAPVAVEHTHHQVVYGGVVAFCLEVVLPEHADVPLVDSESSVMDQVPRHDVELLALS